MKKIPVTIPYFDDREKEAVGEVLASGWVAQGPKVTQFEKVIALHEGVEEGVATTSCTTALHLAMEAMGMTEGMDVFVPAFTFVATANAVVETGATPVFVDVKRETFNVDAEAVQKIIEDCYEEKPAGLVNRKTGNVLWGIVPVHEFGLCCEIYRINEIAEKYGLKVVEDAACALGAKIGETHVGGFGNPACISFHPRKSITTGEGGMVLTDDGQMAKQMRELRTHGSTVSAEQRHSGKGFLLPEFNQAGYNYRMTDLQAAVGLVQSDKLDYIIEQKQKKAAIYDRLINEQIPEFIIPSTPENYFHTYQSYVCMLDYEKLGLAGIEEGGEYRNRLLEKLEEAGIATRQGTHAVHMLGYYKTKYGYQSEDYVNAYACDRLSITLPLYVQLTETEQRYVVDTVKNMIETMKGWE